MAEICFIVKDDGINHQYGTEDKGCSFFPARALWQLQADGSPTVGWGNTFWRVGRYFYENGHTRKRNVEKSKDPSFIPMTKYNCILIRSFKNICMNFLFKYVPAILLNVCHIQRYVVLEVERFNYGSKKVNEISEYC